MGEQVMFVGRAPTRAVIFVPAGDDEKTRTRWLDQCMHACARADLEVISIARDWHGAEQALGNDEVDVCVVARADHVPSRVLVASETAESAEYVPAKQRRPRLIRQGVDSPVRYPHRHD